MVLNLDEACWAVGVHDVQNHDLSYVAVEELGELLVQGEGLRLLLAEEHNSNDYGE